MAFTKITQQELNSRGATTLPNQPTIPAQQLKQEFDAPAKEIVAPKVNNLIDELEATSAAASIGAVAPTGRSGDTVKEVLDDISGDLSAVEGTSHSHSNKSLLDSYDQTNANLSDAVTKKHEHNNKSVLDKFSESGGKPLYDGQTIGEGDMKKSDYDSDSTVKNAGGIKAYVDARASAAYRPSGTKTVAELLPALLIEANNNNVYNITDSGLTTEYFQEGAGKPIYPGDNVGIAYVSPNTYKFDLLRGIVDLTPYAKTADLGTAAAKNTTNAVTQASTDLVESGAVYASVHAVAQDLSDTNLAVAALQTASMNLGKYKAEADSIAPVELDATGASQAYAVDEQFYLIDVLLTATSPIAQNDAIVVYPTSGYNCKPSDSITEQIADRVTYEDNGILGASNFFDSNVYTSVTLAVDVANMKYANGSANIGYAKVEPNRKYKISRKTAGTQFRVATSADVPDYNVPITYTVANHTGKEITIEIGATDVYIGIYTESISALQDFKICLATDTNPTFPPYAETNRQLTQNKMSYKDNGVLGARNWFFLDKITGSALYQKVSNGLRVYNTISGVWQNRYVQLNNLLKNTDYELSTDITYVSGTGLIIIAGSNDGTNYTALSTVQEITSSQRFVTKFNTGNYTYYRALLNCTRATAGTGDLTYANLTLKLASDTSTGYTEPTQTNHQLTVNKAEISTIAPAENGATASQAYAIGEHFQRNGKFCTCIQAIAQDAKFTLNTNYVEGTIADVMFSSYKFVGLEEISVTAGDDETFDTLLTKLRNAVNTYLASLKSNEKILVSGISGFFSCIGVTQTLKGNTDTFSGTFVQIAFTNSYQSQVIGYIRIATANYYIRTTLNSGSQTFASNILSNSITSGSTLTVVVQKYVK